MRLAALLLLLAPVAQAEPSHVLRMASVAPEGTAWARELGAFARHVEVATRGAVRVRWYLGGIAGDDIEVAERIRRDQLDGAASAGPLCQRLAPSMGVTRVVGLFQSREESAYIVGRLKPTFDAEFDQSGFVNLMEAGLGPEVFLTREPVRGMADLRRLRLWVWDLDPVLLEQLRELGLQARPLPVAAAARAWDEAQIDGFVTTPSGALGFQWSSRARFLSDLRFGFLSGCVVVAHRAFDGLPMNAQQAVRAAAAKLQARLEEVGGRQDEALLGGVFARQGLQTVAASDAFRSEFLQGARAVRDRLGDRIAPRPLLQRVMEMLADYRAEHPTRSP